MGNRHDELGCNNLFQYLQNLKQPTYQQKYFSEDQRSYFQWLRVKDLLTYFSSLKLQKIKKVYSFFDSQIALQD